MNDFETSAEEMRSRLERKKILARMAAARRRIQRSESLLLELEDALVRGENILPFTQRGPQRIYFTEPEVADLIAATAPARRRSILARALKLGVSRESVYNWLNLYSERWQHRNAEQPALATRTA